MLNRIIFRLLYVPCLFAQVLTMQSNRQNPQFVLHSPVEILQYLLKFPINKFESLKITVKVNNNNEGLHEHHRYAYILQPYLLLFYQLDLLYKIF